jgi:hypothetical protein
MEELAEHRPVVVVAAVVVRDKLVLRVVQVKVEMDIKHLLLELILITQAAAVEVHRTVELVVKVVKVVVAQVLLVVRIHLH